MFCETSMIDVSFLKINKQVLQWSGEQLTDF